MSGDEGVVIKREGVREWVSEEGRSEVGGGAVGGGLKKKGTDRKVDKEEE